MYKRFLKRFFDVIISLIGILVAAIPMLLIALVIKCDSKGPVIFKQERLGYKGKVFNILKFRTMTVGAEKTGSGVYSFKGDSRVTRFGRILRATSLDELPQMFNILKGEMSIIGFRPPLTYHPWKIEDYTPEQLRMFDVLPGLSGWAQVNGRKNVEWNRRIELNVWYVDNISFLLDVKIFFKTILSVLKNSDNENKGQTVQEKPENKEERVN